MRRTTWTADPPSSASTIRMKPTLPIVVLVHSLFYSNSLATEVYPGVEICVYKTLDDQVKT